MSTPEKKFIMDLCEEHVDEAAFLYALHRNILSGTAWPSAQRFEERLCAHLDALLLEGAPAVAVCEARTSSSDPGDLYVAAGIACQNNTPDLIAAIFDGLSPDNEKKVTALCDALTDEASFRPERVLGILAAHRTHPRVTAKVAGDARMKDAWPLIETQENDSPETLAQVLRLAGRIRKTDTVSLLLRSLDHDDGAVRSEAALALLRLGKGGDVVRHCRAQNSPMIALGLGGGKPELSFLLELSETGPVTRELLIALGLLGDISAFPVLIDSLGIEALSEPAAHALELVTGAGIFENIFVPEETDKKELFKDELEKLEHGENPHPPGEEPGATVTRISQNPDHWRKWLDENERRFVSGTRYRNGRPFSPECLVDNMKSEILPGLFRQLAYEETVIRYGKDVSFETGRPVSFQKRAIRKYEDWAQTLNGKFYAGQWYFAGQPMA